MTQKMENKLPSVTELLEKLEITQKENAELTAKVAELENQIKEAENVRTVFERIEFSETPPKIEIQYPFGGDYTVCCFCGYDMDVDEWDICDSAWLDAIGKKSPIVERSSWCKHCHHLSLTSWPCCLLHHAGCGICTFAAYAIKEIKTKKKTYVGFPVIPPELLKPFYIRLCQEDEEGTEFKMYCANCSETKWPPRDSED